MKISEIEKETGYPSDETMSELVSYRFANAENSKKIGTIDGYDLYSSFVVWVGGISYFLVDGEKPIAQMGIRDDTRIERFIKITSVWINPAYRGKGLIKKLYQYLLDHNHKIVSDQTQSDSAKIVWKSFIGSGRLYLFDENEESLSPVSSIEDFEKAYSDKKYRLILK